MGAARARQVQSRRPGLRGAVGSRRKGRGGLGPWPGPAGRQPQSRYPGPRCPGAESRPWRNSLRRSRRPGPRPWPCPSSPWSGGTRNQTGLPSICSRYSMEQLSTTSSIAPLACRLGRIWKTRAGGCEGLQGLPESACQGQALSPRKPPPASPPPYPSGPFGSQGLGRSGCPRGTGQTWERAQRTGTWGSVRRALAHRSPRVPSWPDNDSTFSRSAPHGTSSCHPS